MLCASQEGPIQKEFSWKEDSTKLRDDNNLDRNLDIVSQAYEFEEI